jgi:DNA-binding phage protein
LLVAVAEQAFLLNQVGMDQVVAEQVDLERETLYRFLEELVTQ